MSTSSDVPEAVSPSTSGLEGETGQAPPQKKLPPGLRPYPKFELPSTEQLAAEESMNNCAVRTVVSLVMGGGLGAMFGIFMGTMDSAGLGIDGRLAGENQKQTVRQVVKEMVKNTGSRSWSYAKGFGAMGALFAGSECVIEKVRAKHDMYNSVYAGCTAGAILAHSGGPKAMAVGCGSFAAFSAAIDYFMGHH